MSCNRQTVHAWPQPGRAPAQGVPLRGHRGAGQQGRRQGDPRAAEESSRSTSTSSGARARRAWRPGISFPTASRTSRRPNPIHASSSTNDLPRHQHRRFYVVNRTQSRRFATGSAEQVRAGHVDRAARSSRCSKCATGSRRSDRREHNPNGCSNDFLRRASRCSPSSRRTRRMPATSAPNSEKAGHADRPLRLSYRRPGAPAGCYSGHGQRSRVRARARAVGGGLGRVMDPAVVMALKRTAFGDLVLQVSQEELEKVRQGIAEDQAAAYLLLASDLPAQGPCCRWS